MQKGSILEVRLDANYTLSIELFLDRFGQSNKFRKKSKKKFRNIQKMTPIVPKTCFQGPLGDVLRTSLGHPETTSQGHLLDVRLERPLNLRLGCSLDVISRRSQDDRLERPQDGQIGSLGDALETLEGDVLRTSWGPIFAGWDVSIKSIDCILLSSFELKAILLISSVKTLCLHF